MKVVKIAVVLLLVYVGIVGAFESLIGYLQPQSETTLVITTTDAERAQSERVLARLESGGKLYVAANHWPRAWYRQVLRNPEIEVALDGSAKGSYRAVPLAGEEQERVNREHSLPWIFRVLTGFPPRYLVRLDPA